MTKEVEITSLTYGGRGLGRIDNKVVFVPFSVPGDKLSVEITKDKKSFAEAEIKDILEPSVDRVEPKCPVFGLCGGCAWQNISYPKQLEWKERILKETLTRIGGVELPEFDPPIKAKEPYNYRSRARFQIDQIDNGKWGFFAASSHTLVDIEECPLLEPNVNETFGALKKLLKGKEHGLCHIEIAQSERDNRTVASLYSVKPFAFGKMDFLSATPLLKGVELLRSKAKSKDRRKNKVGRRDGPFTSVKKYGELDIFFTVLGRELKAPSGSFTQVNAAQNNLLVEKVCEMGALDKNARVLDLFSGVGNITFALAKEAESVTGVEIDSLAVDYARANAALGGDKNAQFECADVLKWVKNKGSKSLASPLWNVVVLDPPRGGTPNSGSVNTTRELVKLAPRRIIYVSCNPSTLARDISCLRDSGYAIKRAVLLDMFPQTFHIESVVMLDRE